MKQQTVVTHWHSNLQETQNQTLTDPQQTNTSACCFYESGVRVRVRVRVCVCVCVERERENILTEGVFVTQLSSNVEISADDLCGLCNTAISLSIY
jgi:hypothetical protein